MSKNIKKRISASLIILGFCLSLGLGYTLARGEKVRRGEHQPRMRAALQLLKNAKSKLQKATHDKGGHRVKAIRYIDNAIKEVKMGIRFDNRH